jgi:poly-beta-hydroxyalkanoate depolymerase
MPSSFMTLFPQFLNGLEVMKIPLQRNIDLAEMATESFSQGFDFIQNLQRMNCRIAKEFFCETPKPDQEGCGELLDIYREGSESILNLWKQSMLDNVAGYQRRRSGDLKFLEFFTEKMTPQRMNIEPENMKVLLDLPGLRLIDISMEGEHRIRNYSVVFAPRAGHHSNIAERAAFYMRSQGLTRMAIVEQKCAEEIPLYVDGIRHDEGFDGQVDQYRRVLECLKDLTGYPSHLIAICQPGPLLISTLILYPHLGKTFGSSGSPMHTEAERGFLTDFARFMGEDMIDRLLALFGGTVSSDHPGAGREYYDGRFHVLGFYFLGLEQHQKNINKLLADLRDGDETGAERQKAFYRWYNHVLHSPSEFMRDTYKRIFVNNELIRGTLQIGGKKVSIKDYPGSVPIWALGGTKDDITPPLQATAHMVLLDHTPPLQAIGHMDLIDSVPSDDKLTLICGGGHMGLFRSVKILEEFYKKIVEFILDRSDKMEM